MVAAAVAVVDVIKNARAHARTRARVRAEGHGVELRGWGGGLDGWVEVEVLIDVVREQGTDMLRKIIGEANAPRNGERVGPYVAPREATELAIELLREGTLHTDSDQIHVHH